MEASVGNEESRELAGVEQLSPGWAVARGAQRLGGRLRTRLPGRREFWGVNLVLICVEVTIVLAIGFDRPWGVLGALLFGLAFSGGALIRLAIILKSNAPSTQPEGGRGPSPRAERSGVSRSFHRDRVARTPLEREGKNGIIWGTPR